MTKELVPTWLYAAPDKAEIFQLPRDTRDFPAGWFDSPAKVVAPAAPAPPRDPLDHDGDGRKGGSLPKARRR